MKSSLMRLILAAGTSLLLAGCFGTSGGSSTPAPVPVNKSPTANAGADHSVDEHTEDSLRGTGKDSDGSISSYTWTQTAGPSVKLAVSADDPAEVSYTAPDVSQTTQLKFELTVTDDSGATASDDVTVSVAPTIKLQGKVVDGPIANAIVTVTIGDKTYTATAADDGTYTLTVGAIDPDAFITINATGSGDQSNVQLVHIAGTFGALETAAGDDAVLDSSDSGTTDVTNVSTAQAALMLEVNDGQAPTDDATLTDLQKSVDGDALIQLATVIKLVIDEGVPLPDGVDNTMDLVTDTTAVDAVIDQADATDPNLFSDTMNEVLNDPAVATAFTKDNVPSQYFINRVGGYVFGNRGYLLTFNQDGTGHDYGADAGVSAAFTWTIDSDGRIAIHFDDADPLVIRASCPSTFTGGGNCAFTTTDLTIQLVTDGVDVDTLNIHEFGTISDLSFPDQAPQPEDFSSLLLGMAPGALEPFTAADVTGTWSVPLALLDSTHGTYVTDLLTFNADGTGMRPADGVTFKWSIGSDQGLDIAFATGDDLKLYWLRSDGELGIDALVHLTTNGGDIYTIPQLVVRGVTATYPSTLTLADVDGFQEYMDWTGFGFDIDANAGTATYTNYEDGVITSSYLAGISYDGIKFDVPGLYDLSTNTYIASCAGVSACQEYSDVKWYPLAKDSSGRLFVLEVEHDWAWANAPDNYYRGAETFYDHVNRWLKPAAAPVAASQTTALGERVRKALGNPLVVAHRREVRLEK
ncbi:MAG TPA: hypothetical protein VFH85_01360 [Gammaproteobacteria bacterium]|nr:hypothetical protein [Gammaproteobacteria bacterium]